MTDQAKNKETGRKLFEDILNTGHLELLNQVIGEDYTGPTGEKGAAGFEETVAPILAAFPDIKYTLEDVIAEGDKVVVRWSWKGTHTGNFRGFPPSQKQVHNDAIVIFQLAYGKIVQSRMQTDRLGFLQQMGAVSPDLGAPPKK